MQLVITTVTAEGAAGFNAASIIAILTSEARVEWKCADTITSRTFTTVRFKEGYSTREVDDFLDEIVDRMATGDHSLARRIKEKTFSNVRFRGGYDIDEVDDFLDEVARGLEGDAGASTGASTASAAAAIPDPHETVAPEPGTSYTSDANLAAPSSDSDAAQLPW